MGIYRNVKAAPAILMSVRKGLTACMNALLRPCRFSTVVNVAVLDIENCCKRCFMWYPLESDSLPYCASVVGAN